MKKTKFKNWLKSWLDKKLGISVPYRQYINKLEIILNGPNARKAVLHDKVLFENLTYSKRRIKEVILFCDATWTENLDKKLSVTTRDNGDIGTNLWKVWQPNEIYKTKEDFLEAVKLLISFEPYEENGFLNFKIPDDFLRWGLGYTSVLEIEKPAYEKN